MHASRTVPRRRESSASLHVACFLKQSRTEYYPSARVARARNIIWLTFRCFLRVVSIGKGSISFCLSVSLSLSLCLFPSFLRRLLLSAISRAGVPFLPSPPSFFLFAIYACNRIVAYLLLTLFLLSFLPPSSFSAYFRHRRRCISLPRIFISFCPRCFHTPLRIHFLIFIGLFLFRLFLLHLVISAS